MQIYVYIRRNQILKFKKKRAGKFNFPALSYLFFFPSYSPWKRQQQKLNLDIYPTHFPGYMLETRCKLMAIVCRHAESEGLTAVALAKGRESGAFTRPNESALIYTRLGHLFGDYSRQSLPCLSNSLKKKEKEEDKSMRIVCACSLGHQKYKKKKQQQPSKLHIYNRLPIDDVVLLSLFLPLRHILYVEH